MALHQRVAFAATIDRWKLDGRLRIAQQLATQRTDNLSAEGVSHLAALNSGFHLAYLVGAALVGVGRAIAVLVLRYEPVPEGAVAPEGAPERSREPVYSEG